MKKIILLFLFVGLSKMTYSQFSFGLRGGLNYGGSVSLEDISTGSKIKDKTKDNVGFHAGFYSKIGLGIFYVMPELVYTNLGSSISKNDVSSEYNIQKLDLPISFGWKFLPFLSVFVGPSFQYIIDTSFTNVELKNIESNITAGYNIGVGAQISKLGVNLRYESSLSQNNIDIFNKTFNTKTGTIDSRPSQIILAVTFKLN